MTAVLGVDGGGSKTHAAICDEHGALIGAGTAGPSNWETVGLRGASATASATRSSAPWTAPACAAPSWTRPCSAWPVSTGRPTCRGWRGRSRRSGLGVPPAIVNDSFIALRAGVRAPWGVVVIAGTGTVAAGRNSAGETFRTLGLGRLLGDEGSASDVGEAALRAVARAYVGRGPATSLSEGLCELMGAATVAQLLEEYSRGGERESNAAPRGAAPCRARATRSRSRSWSGRARSWARRRAVVASRLAMDDEPFELVMSGGLFHGRSERLEQRIASEVPTALLTRLEAPPVVGAVLMALEQRGSRPTSEVHDRIGRSLVTAFR